MTKLKGAKLQELATTLASSQELGNKQLSAIKGGCSSCQDIRIPPKVG